MCNIMHTGVLAPKEKLLLPPRLAQVKEQITAKPSWQRSTQERELLAELNTIDTDISLQKSLEGSFKEMRSFGPGGGACPCCGH
jgi:hypothetical protein